MRKIAGLLPWLLFAPAAFSQDCVNIYFDRVTPDYWMGRTYSIFVQNLMGHFPRFQQVVSPIEKYRAGDVERCAATIYIGSHYFAQIPPAFVHDYVHTRKNVAWVGYNIWRLGEDLEAVFGHRYSRLTTLDFEHLDAKGLPTFFREIRYKGETFRKFAERDKVMPDKILASFEQTVLVPTVGGRSDVIASARHTFTGEIVPYILRAENHFFVADVPFSFMHESDRYLVFADVLFDILNEKPRHNGRYAFLRVEDVHALTPSPYTYKIVQVLRDEKVPINISLIPIFFDPLMRLARNPTERLVPMNRSPQFMQFISEMKDMNATFIWHGVTHQYKSKLNPYDATSGSDFEFFDAPARLPVSDDSVAFVMDRLNEGWHTLERSGVAPRMWLTPHYQASPLDYAMFAQLFPWNVGRVIYFNAYVDGLQSVASEASLWFGSLDPGAEQARHRAFGSLRVLHEDGQRWNGQFFPYEIFGDVYGQRIIPENLGNSQPYISEHVVRYRTTQDIIDDARRNLVLRDAWASLFYHPFLLATRADDGEGRYPGDPAVLRHLIKSIKAMGYRFVDINGFLEANTLPKRPEPIYKERQP